MNKYNKTIPLTPFNSKDYFMKVTSSKKVTNSEPSTIKSNLQKLQAIKKVTKNEKGQQKKLATMGLQPATTGPFLWSNSLQPASVRA
jgi:hypothetical protein